MVQGYLGIKPVVKAMANAAPDPEAVASTAAMMAERPLDQQQRRSVEILRAKGMIK